MGVGIRDSWEEIKMKTIGFPISHKENENRRALLPEHIINIEHPECLWFETGYGKILQIEDDEFVKCGAHVCSREEALTKDIICDPKVGDAEYLEQMNEGQTIFGWVHATQNYDITEKIVQHGLSAYAWESMYEKGRHIFWRNNELAGEAAVLHAYQCWGEMPYRTKVAVIGRGNTAGGAIKILHVLGASVRQYSRSTEELFKEELPMFDVVVNCVLWDVKRKDHIITKEDLKHMKKGALIIDVSCDKNGAIETSVPTTIESPTYKVEGIMHYVVDHTPSLYYKTFSYENSQLLYRYINQLINETCGSTLQNALIIENGNIVDNDINVFQGREK